MSSSITFAFQHLADYPEVLAKVREEQERVRGDDLDSPITLDVLDQMPYVHAVVKEVLRHRPPVIMVPYLVKKAFPLTDDYTVPKGTMLMYVYILRLVEIYQRILKEANTNFLHSSSTVLHSGILYTTQLFTQIQRNSFLIDGCQEELMKDLILRIG